MAGERVLVTGASGFTGAHLCERLVLDGYRVRALVRDPAKASRLVRLGAEVVEGDLVESRTAVRATKGMEIVFHVAALYRQEGVPRKAFWAVNVTGTDHLLRAAVRHDVTRFIHCSTVGVHGDVGAVPANEDAPFRPGDPYQVSKLEGEKVAAAYVQRGDLAVTIVRPTGIYGPGDLRFLKLFRVIARNRFWMIGTGDIFYHLTYIDDLVDGILLCAVTPRAAGRAYILAGREYVTLNQLVALIAEALGAAVPHRRLPVLPVYALAYVCELICRPLGIEPPLYRRRVDFFRKHRTFDITRAVTELGFAPKVDLKTGLRKTGEWYRDNGHI